MLRANPILSLLLGLATVISTGLASSRQSLAQEQIEISANAQTTPFPHFWEQMFGSGRAILTLRESYRERSARGKAGD